MVQVRAKNAEMAKLLKHPISKVGFVDANQPAYWPDDSFTARRVADGDVVLVEDSAAKASPKAPKNESSQ
jgi:hypothetical protein